MKMAKRRIARRVGFEKCLIPWKKLNKIHPQCRIEDHV